MADEIIAPQIQEPFLNADMTPNIEAHTWMEQVTERLQPPLTGTGTPEGVLSANAGRFYVDTAANQIYMKVTGTGNTGWQAT